MTEKNILLPSESICTGCGACEGVCLSDAIVMKEQGESHSIRPEIAVEKCIQCGECQRVCPMQNDIEMVTPKEVYAANNKNIKKRELSASGGIFEAIASEMLCQGGSVIGVRYVGPKECEHVMITEETELNSLCGTKYFQSLLRGKIYQQLLREVRKNKEVLFCGTPCQTAAIRRFALLNGISDRITTVEILCRGIVPAIIQRETVNYLERRYIKRIKSIRYKEKSRGWNKIGSFIHFEDDTDEYLDISENLLLRFAYERNIGIRESCFNCRFKTTKRNADITIGDFWGYEDKRLFDNKGTSFIFVNTERGKVLLNKAKERLDMIPDTMSFVAKNNKSGFNPVTCDEQIRKEFWARLNKGERIEDIASIVLNSNDKMADENISDDKRIIERDNRILGLYERWIVSASKGFSIGEFLVENQFRHVAIFGYGTLGRALRCAIAMEDINVDYIIESNENRWDDSCSFYMITEELPAVDLILVSAIVDFDSIFDRLRKIVKCPILSLEDIIP